MTFKNLVLSSSLIAFFASDPLCASYTEEGSSDSAGKKRSFSEAFGDPIDGPSMKMHFTDSSHDANLYVTLLKRALEEPDALKADPASYALFLQAVFEDKIGVECQEAYRS